MKAPRPWTGAVFVAALAVAPPAFGQAQEKAAPRPAAARETAAAPPSWTVNCASSGASLACKAQQTIVVGATRQLLLRVSLSRTEDGKTLALLLQLPHGLYNPAGVVTEIDTSAGEMLAIQTCDAGGCYAGSPLPPEKVAAMTKGERLKVTFQDLRKQRITVPVPLKGLDEAVKKL